MGLRLILGPSASGKTYQITREIAGKVKAMTAGEEKSREIFYITPEQTTLQVEKMLMKRLGTHTLFGISVFGFKRLAYRVFEEIGMPDIVWLDDVGKSMILQRIAREHQKELSYFARSISQKGFIDRLKMMITEIIQYRLGEEELKSMALAQPEGSILRGKLEDIALLWHYFLQYMEENEGGSRLMASEMLLDEFASVITRSRMLEDAEIYIDGYTGFTPQQYRILEELLKKAKNVTVCLTVSEEAAEEADQIRDWRDLPRRLYFTAQKTIAKLSDLSAALQIPRERILLKKEDVHRPEEITHALENLFGNGTHIWPGMNSHVRAYAAKNQEEELEQLMHQVLKLVREEGYSFKDIHVVCTDLAGYVHSLRRKAELYRIPVFIDDKVDVKLNPLIQWLEMCCEWITGGYARGTLISLIKTGLCNADQASIDVMENVALKENWIGKDRLLEGIGIYLPDLKDQLQIFTEEVHEAVNASEYTDAIVKLAEKQQIETQLQQIAEALQTEGKVLHAMQYARIYEQVHGMMEQLKKILGTVEVSFEEYVSMLKIGMAECRMGQLPSTLDELTVGDLQRSKVESCKALFVLGLQGGSFPVIAQGASLLTDTERGKVNNMPEIAQGDKESLMEQYYLLQLTMGKAQDMIYLFSHKVGEDGEEIGESSLWRRIGKSFVMESCLLEKDQGPTLPLPLLYEAGKETLVSEVLQEEIEKGFREDVLRGIQMVRSGRESRESDGAISPLLASSLMDPTKRLLSVTQLERYAKCPYGYYLHYGLGLKEREEPKVTQLEDGTVLHELLKEAGEYIREILSEEEAEKIARELSEAKAGDYQVYQSSGRFRYYWQKLQKTAAWSLQMLSRQHAYSSFEPTAFEWEFSDKPGSGEAVRIPLKNGQEIQLQGKIDRIDIWSEEEQRYVQILDYKSGSTDMDLNKLNAGVQLQLPVYMEAAEKNFQAKPAGFFYFHLTPKEVKEEEGKNLEDEMLYANRLSGMYVHEADLMRKMDSSMEPGKRKAKVIPGALLKSGQPNKNTLGTQASQEQMEDLKEFVHRRIRNSAEGILDGQFPREPLGDKSGGTPCSYCEFRQACPYDKEIPGTRRKKMEEIPSGKFWDRVESEKNEHS